MLHIVGSDGGESSIEHKPFREAQHLSSRSIGGVCVLLPVIVPGDVCRRQMGAPAPP